MRGRHCHCGEKGSKYSYHTSDYDSNGNSYSLIHCVFLYMYYYLIILNDQCKFGLYKRARLLELACVIWSQGSCGSGQNRFWTVSSCRPHATVSFFSLTSPRNLQQPSKPFQVLLNLQCGVQFQFLSFFYNLGRICPKFRSFRRLKMQY